MRSSLRLVGWALLAVSAILATAGAAGWWVYRETTGTGAAEQKRARS